MTLESKLADLGMHIEEARTVPAPPPLTAERRMLYAILISAFEDLESDRYDEQYAGQAWIEGEGDAQVTFLDVCDQLDLDPEAVAAIAFDGEKRREALRRYAALVHADGREIGL